jgi:AcrR family transcriptional regulator
MSEHAIETASTAVTLASAKRVEGQRISLLTLSRQICTLKRVSTATGGRRKGRGARERITAAAANLFYWHGINATGVDRLIEEAQVSKRTFYQHFPSKVELVEAYLRGFDERGGAPLERRLGMAELAPRERMLAIFDASISKRFRGCPFHNAAVESAGTLGQVEEIVRTHKQWFAEQLAAVAAEAGAADPWLLAQHLLVVFEGATALSTSLGDLSPLVHARSAAAQLIDGACRDPFGATSEPEPPHHES